MDLHDEINIEIDRRKIEELDLDLSNAPIISKSECCGATFKGNNDGTDVRCSKCNQKANQ